MTVSIIAAVNPYGFSVGNVRTLPAADEATGIAAGWARAFTTPNPAGDDLPVRYDPGTGQIVMGDGGTIAAQAALMGVVSEYGIALDEYTDTVTLSATGIVHPMAGRLSVVTVVSGSCDLALADGAGTGTAGIRAIATMAGLTAGDTVPFPGDGLPFVNALLATITGTATVKFEVI